MCNMPTAYEETNFISLSALEENFIIRNSELFHIFRKENISSNIITPPAAEYN